MFPKMALNCCARCSGFMRTRGLGYVQVDHTFVNDNLETSFTDIGSMYMKIRTAGGAAETNEIIQTHDDRLVVNGQVGDKRLQGHVRAGDVEVEMEDFWQQYPKSLRTSAEGIEIGLCPSIGQEDYRVDEDEEYKLYFYLREGVYRFREGMSKTHTIYVGEGLGDGVESLLAEASVEWNCGSGAFSEITPGTNGRFPEYEEKAVQVFGEYLEDRDSGRDYGMLNYGDYFAGNRTWGNTEYDTGPRPDTRPVQPARSGREQGNESGPSRRQRRRNSKTGPRSGYGNRPARCDCRRSRSGRPEGVTRPTVRCGSPVDRRGIDQ